MKFIALTKGYQTQVDDADYAWLMQWSWYASIGHTGLVYARRRKRNYEFQTSWLVSMQNELLGLERNAIVDHEDNDTLNNQRFNLRACSQSSNLANRRIGSNNTSGFKGISLDKRVGRWAAYVTFKGKRTFLGMHDDEVQAARAYDRHAIKTFGEFALTNFPIGDYI